MLCDLDHINSLKKEQTGIYFRVFGQIVKKQDADYEKAESKIRKYQVIRDLHANNETRAEK